eukprot:9503859-Pyramimonas_sp.AAC.1
MNSRHWKGEAKHLRTKLSCEHKRHAEFAERVTMQRQRKRRGVAQKPWLSVRGGYSMAARRNNGHTGSKCMQLQFMRPTSKDVIPRWERLLGTCCVMLSQEWYRCQYDRVAAGIASMINTPIPTTADSPGKKFSYEINSIAGDATNTAVREHKAHTCRIVSKFHFVQQDGDEPGLQYNECQEVWADLMQVPSSAGGVECRSMYLKQCRSSGLRDWLDESTWLCQPAFTADTSSEGIDFEALHLRCFAWASDRGSDQAKADRLISDDIARQLFTLTFRAWCLRHQLHLCVKRHLEFMDDIKHFSNCAKICNLWRSSGVARRVYDGFVGVAGKHVADHVAKTLPPRALRGRWSSISKLELFIRRCGREHLPRAIEFALKKISNNKQSSRGPLLAESDDDTPEAYQRKLGRWRQDVLAAVASDEFWLGLEIASVTRSPITMIERWQERQQNPSKAKGHDMFVLVTDMRFQVEKEFDNLFSSASWGVLFDPASYENMDGGIDVNQDDWVLRAVASILQLAVDFFHRVVLPCEIWPRLLMWLIASPWNMKCDARMHVADELLRAPPQALDLTCQKIRIIFNDELRRA